jgi:hypothetical protein
VAVVGLLKMRYDMGRIVAIATRAGWSTAPDDAVVTVWMSMEVEYC